LFGGSTPEQQERLPPAQQQAPEKQKQQQSESTSSDDDLKYSFQFTTVLNGNISAIHRDNNDVLWVGTTGGLFRYNGSLRSLMRGQTDSETSERRLSSPDTSPRVRGDEGGESYRNQANEEFVQFSTKDGLVNNWVNAIDHDEDGTLWIGTQGGISCYDGKGFINFTTTDGLVHNGIRAIHCEKDGALWFGTYGSGVSCYDGKSIVNITTADGLLNNAVRTIHRDLNGALWFGTYGGASRLLSKRMDSSTLLFGDSHPEQQKGRFLNFTPKDGLLEGKVTEIEQTPDGILWFASGSLGSVLSQYDGQKFDAIKCNENRFEPFKKEDPSGGYVSAMHVSPDGELWLATFPWASRHIVSIYRYDGKSVNLFNLGTFENRGVSVIHAESDGVLWFGTFSGGVSKYEIPYPPLSSPRIREDRGGEFIHFTIEDGLPNNRITSIYRGQDGMLWFGTWSGLCRYDGKNFLSFTEEPRLGHDRINAICDSSDGVLWIGTMSGGVVAYDGNAFTSLDTRDGLADNWIHDIYEDSDGYLWFATAKGITRYKRSVKKPSVRIVAVQEDKKYTDLTAIPPITAKNRVMIEYQGIDVKTIPEKRQYRYRITNYELRVTNSNFLYERKFDQRNKRHATHNTDSTYNYTKETTYEWISKKPGSYIFEVQAIDRDLNYSETASVTLKVIPPWYLNGWIALPSGAGILVFLVSSAFATSRYFTQRRKAQKLQVQLLEEERKSREAAESANQAKSTFLASMSHDIRTPLNAILGYAQILQREKDLQPNQRSAVKTIESSGNHLLALINDILDISKIESGQAELAETNFDLTQLINELFVVFQLRCEQKGLDLRLEWGSGKMAKGQEGEEQDERSILVYGDEGKLRRTLMNLLANAVKFTETGEIILRISQSSTLEDKVTSTMSESKTVINYFTFEVIDTGVGISPEKQATIFEPFIHSDSRAEDRSSTEKEGTGLGLTIAKKYVAVMGGDLSVESIPQKGSRFFFTVPLQSPGEKTTSIAADLFQKDSQTLPTSLANGVKVKALVADDNLENRSVLSQMFENIAVTVVTAENGQQALEKVRDERPDIVFMDIWMPVMDGLETTEQILKEFKEERPILVAFSASALVHEQQKYSDAGFDDFIPKPVRAEQIYDCLAKLLHIEYEYGDDVVSPSIDFEKIVFPEELLLHLRDAAELSNVTALRDKLDEVRELGEPGRLLAEQLYELSRQFDMEGILRILEAIKHR